MIFICVLDRAAVLERMPVVDRTLPGPTNGDLIKESPQDSNPCKALPGVPVIPLEPKSQVFEIVFALTDL